MQAIRPIGTTRLDADYLPGHQWKKTTYARVMQEMVAGFMSLDNLHAAWTVRPFPATSNWVSVKNGTSPVQHPKGAWHFNSDTQSEVQGEMWLLPRWSPEAEGPRSAARNGATTSDDPLCADEEERLGITVYDYELSNFFLLKQD